MNTTFRSAQTTSQSPAQSSSAFSSPSTTTSTLGSSTNLTGAVEQPLNPFSFPANPANPVFATPLQPASAYPTQSGMSQARPLAQTLANPAASSAFPVVSQNMEQPVPNAEGPLAHQAAANYPHQVSGLGGPTATAPFLQDFNLVAEAAKRAQMSIVMRDLESVTL